MEPTTAEKPATGQRFKFFTGTVKAFTRANGDGGEDLIISGIASSNVRDRYGDTMSSQCQLSMLNQAKKLTMFGNHDYDVPEDIFGKCVTATLETSGDVMDLAIEMQIAKSNPRALQSFKLIHDDKIQLAFSIGGIIKDAEIDEENDDGSSWWPPLIINDLDLLEISLVGIPANPRAYTRSFLEDIKKSAFKAATRDPGVQKAFLRSIGVPDVAEEFSDLRDAETVNTELAAADPTTPAETTPAESADVEVPDEQCGVTVELDSEQVAALIAQLLADVKARQADLEEIDMLVVRTQTECSDLATQRDAMADEIKAKVSERDALVSEIATLEERLKVLKATPTGRQTQATPNGSSAKPGKKLSEMTDAELRDYARSLDRQAAGVDARQLGAGDEPK